MWEEVCDVIEEREAALSELESFERMASDPSRFFARGTYAEMRTPYPKHPWRLASCIV